MQRLSVIGAVVFGGVFAVASISGQVVSISNFSTTSILVMNGSAAVSGTVLRLTPSSPSVAGSAFIAVPLLVVGGFETTFTFRITPGSAPAADGLAFVVHNSVAGAFSLGDAGGEMGYTNVVAGTLPSFGNSLAFEFDTYANLGETSSNEISIHADGSGPNQWQESYSIGHAVPPTLLANAQVHTARVVYTPGNLSLFFDSAPNPLISVPYDIQLGGTFTSTGTPVAGLSLNQGAAYVGFTAGNGGLFAAHDILSWSFTSLPGPAYTGTIGVANGGPYDVLFVNGSAGGSTRRVTAATNQPLSVALLAPPASNGPESFILWGFAGVALPSQAYATGYGLLAFTPHTLAPGAPGLFTIADNIGLGLAPLLPSTPTPWSFSVPSGVPVPVLLTLQGAVLRPTNAPNIQLTNAVTMDVR